MKCAPSEDSDEPGHPPSDQSSLCVLCVAIERTANTLISDQTGYMSRLSKLTSRDVGFVVCPTHLIDLNCGRKRIYRGRTNAFFLH